jgi:hypothetical protein
MHLIWDPNRQDSTSIGQYNFWFMLDANILLLVTFNIPSI